MTSRWTVEAGRHVYFDGQPFLSLNREGRAKPVETDAAAHFVAECLNQHGITPDDLYQRQMGRSRHQGTREATRGYSMTYGTLPPYKQFLVDIRRPDPDEHYGKAYWPKGTDYPMELVNSHEVDLVDGYGGLQPFSPSKYSHKSGFRGDEKAIYGFLEFLTNAFNEGDDEAGDLASSIMTTLGYEWL